MVLAASFLSGLTAALVTLGLLFAGLFAAALGVSLGGA